MGEIAQSLKDFKSNIEPRLDSMSTFCDTLKEKLDKITAVTKVAESSIGSYYKSINQAAIARKFERINEIYTKINTSVESDLKGFVNESREVVDLVNKLVDYNKEIEEKRSIYNKIKDDESQKTEANSIRSAINTKSCEFTNTHTIALEKLNALRSKESTMKFIEEFSSDNTELNLDNLQYGTFELKSFRASNGVEVEYYVYVPDYGKEVDNLPAMLYMHGGSRYQDVAADYAITYGLGEMIANKEITPSGIVIVPVMKNFAEEGIQAVKELTDEVVQEYNVDTDRISVSGHSYGGATAYKLINRYPNYFSCCVPISGAESVTKAFSNMKVWSINGSEEVGTSSTDIAFSKERMAFINSYGGEGYMTIIEGDHKGTNREAFANEYMSPDGEVENPLVWAFKQVKESKKA